MSFWPTRMSPSLIFSGLPMASPAPRNAHCLHYPLFGERASGSAARSLRSCNLSQIEGQLLQRLAPAAGPGLAVEARGGIPRHRRALDSVAPPRGIGYE